MQAFIGVLSTLIPSTFSNFGESSNTKDYPVFEKLVIVLSPEAPLAVVLLNMNSILLRCFSCELGCVKVMGMCCV